MTSDSRSSAIARARRFQESTSEIWSEVGTSNPDFAINVGDTIEGVKDEPAGSAVAGTEADLEPVSIPVLLHAGESRHLVGTVAQNLQERNRATRITTVSIFRTRTSRFSTTRGRSNSTTTSSSFSKRIEGETGPQSEIRLLPQAVLDRDSSMLGSGEFPLHQLPRQYGAGYIVSGHGHQFMRMTRDGIAYLAVGAPARS